VAARLIAERTNAEVRVVTAVTPMYVPVDAFAMTPIPVISDADRRDELVAAANGQVARLAGEKTKWPVDVYFGEPAHALTDAARAVNSRLLVLGRGRHSRTEQLLGGETVLRALQLGDTAVMATEAGFAALPTRVVVAMDFSEFSIYAAQVALSFIAPEATLYLANVRPRFNAADSWMSEWSTAYDEGLPAAFKQVTEALERDGVHIETVTLVGDPATQLLDLAAEKKAELIVSATHGYGFFRRLILGSVATELVRNARCSVLCVPGTARDRNSVLNRSFSKGVTRSYQASEWSDTLSSFSKRNAGRRCTVEIDQPDVGAQVQGSNIPLTGVSYDFHRNEVEIMLGSSELGGSHLTHAIPDATAVDVAIGPDGRDRVLRIGYKGGQTLLTLS
jgi:nucleotide-binding universal stress UspA family protein